MTNPDLTSALAAERRRDFLAEAQRARLARTASAAPVPHTTTERPRWLFGRRTATA